MNERIKELYLHAFPPSLNDSTLCRMSAEKFAELIVRECIDIVAKEHDEGIDRHGDYQLALYEVYREIKQHFGVEP